MAIPDLTSEGVLPAGVHDSDLSELEERFGRFSSSDRRVLLMEKLRAYFDELTRTRFALHLIVDGSFTTGKAVPGDIDMLLVVKAGWDASAQLKPYEYNLVSKKRVRKRYGFDLFIAEVGTPEHQSWMDFFMQVKEVPERRKGLVRVAV